MLTPILMYHEVVHGRPACDDVCASWTVTPEQLHEHLEMLREAGYEGVSLARWLAGEGGARSVVLTFDDGFIGNQDWAIPALSQLGWTATFFVVSGKMGQPGYGDAAGWRDAVRLGMEVASHTITHPFVAALPEAEARRELAGSRAALEDAVGVAVHGFSWPNGDAHRKGRRLLCETGYRYAATSRPGFARAGADPLSLPRLAVRAFHDVAALRRLMDESATHRVHMLAHFRAKQAARFLLGRGGYAHLQKRVSGDAR